MRRFFPIIILALAVYTGAIILSSCDNNKPQHSRLTMLTGGSSRTWHMVFDSSYTGLASNPCVLDNDYIFDTSGNFINRDNGILCDSADTRDLRAQWTLDEDSTMLSFGPGTRLYITLLTDTLMAIEELAPPDGKPERRSVFVAKNKILPLIP